MGVGSYVDQSQTIVGIQQSSVRAVAVRYDVRVTDISIREQFAISMDDSAIEKRWFGRSG